MTYGFQRTATGRVVLRVDDVERGLLMSVARQVMDLVQPAEASPDQDPLAAQLGWVDGDVGISDDPAVARLLPDAYDDPDDARDFRRFTENDLRQSKMQHAMTVVEEIERSGEKVAVTSTDSWLGLLNDARIAIGTRIQISEDNHEELAGLPDGDPRSGLFHVYDWLTFLQESLVRCMDPALYGFSDDNVPVAEDEE
ncbi:MAG: hypothetical protein CMH39_06135 [Micrococcales bacterium]|nr:hypothetical protein [Micrococcales bacterium]MEC8406300.1 DUF2017 domain-containing protein [Actinomycetota bacterium]HBF27985.1 DUF2017 domain-containing protein [Actinomycetota bacterium]